MPIYEYECENCGTHFDKFQSINDDPVRQCPECSGAVHKVFHPAGIIFKGSGWYITDSRKSTSSTVSGESKPVETKTETKTETPAETKSDSKSDIQTEAKPAPATDAK